MGPALDEGDAQYMHFADSAGNRFRALTNSAGKRAGPFLDDSGKSYRGFADAAGNGIEAIKDQAVPIWDDASEWLWHTFQQVSDAAAGVADRLSSQARSVGDTPLLREPPYGTKQKGLTKRSSRTFATNPWLGLHLPLQSVLRLGGPASHGGRGCRRRRSGAKPEGQCFRKAEEIIDKGKVSSV